MVTPRDQPGVPPGRGRPPADVGDRSGAASAGIRRRAFLGAGAVLITGAVVLAVTDPDDRETGPAAPTTDPPEELRRSLAGVLARANAQAGVRLVGSPWSEWYGNPTAAWSAVFASWLLREHGLPRTEDVADLYELFRGQGAVGDRPRPGALIFYADGPVPPHHVGLVTSVSDGVAQTLEGDHPSSLPYNERFVRRFARPWEATSITYAYPSYA